MNPLLKCICFFALFHKFIEAAPKYHWLVPCKNNDDCNDLKNATCSEDGLCVCNNHPMFVCEEITYPIANKIGGKCKESKTCNVNNSECGPQKKCSCKSGYVSSSNRRKCLKIARSLGESCQEHTQCSSGIDSSICSHNKCTCKNGTHEYKGSCFKTAALGASCSRDEECSSTASSSCVNSKCSCIETHVPINQQCLQIAEDIGDSCEEDMQCTTTFGHGSHCSGGTCQCKYFYHYKDKNTTCVRDIFLNELCEDHDECHQPGKESNRLMCILGVCKCKVMYREVDGYCEEITSADGGGVSSLLVKRPGLFILYLFVHFVVTVL